MQEESIRRTLSPCPSLPPGYHAGMDENPYKAPAESEGASLPGRSTAWLLCSFGIGVLWFVSVVWMAIFRDELIADGEPELAMNPFWDIEIRLTAGAAVAIAGIVAYRFYRQRKRPA